MYDYFADALTWKRLKYNMHLSVAYSFEPSLLERLAAIPHVTEIYGKLNGDCIGGDRKNVV